MAPAGFRRCSVTCTADQEAAARLVLLRHSVVEPGSVRFCVTGDGTGRLEWMLDLTRCPVGDAPAVELMLQREVERHR